MPGFRAEKIGLIMAMEEEAKPLIASLGLAPLREGSDTRLPFLIYQGSCSGAQITLSLSGKDRRTGVDHIGTEPAVLNAYHLLDRYAPDLLINAGTAGGFQSRGAEIGDIYLSAGKFRYHDHRIPIPGFDQYGRGDYPTVEVSELSSRLGYKTGVVSTGNSLDFTQECLSIMQDNGACVKEMEAAAIAWVAELMQVPFFAVKSVTDLVDGPHPAAEEFLRNLELASGKLSEAVLAILREITPG